MWYATGPMGREIRYTTPTPSKNCHGTVTSMYTVHATSPTFMRKLQIERCGADEEKGGLVSKTREQRRKTSSLVCAVYESVPVLLCTESRKS